MIEYREIPDADMIELTIDGHIAAEEFHAISEKAQAFMETHKQIRALKEVRNFAGLDFGIFKEKLLGAWLKHMRDIRAVALVCDDHWMEQLAGVLKPVFPYPVRCFKLGQIEEARTWLKSL